MDELFEKWFFEEWSLLNIEQRTAFKQAFFKDLAKVINLELLA